MGSTVRVTVKRYVLEGSTPEGVALARDLGATALAFLLVLG